MANGTIYFLYMIKLTSRITLLKAENAISYTIKIRYITKKKVILYRQNVLFFKKNPCVVDQITGYLIVLKRGPADVVGN